MTATRQDISNWFDAGVAQGSTHLIVVCDTFDYENYPVYVNPRESAREKAERYIGKPMQSVDEVYDLSMDKDDQMAEHRAFNY